MQWNMHTLWKKKCCAGAGGALLLLFLSVGLILLAYLEYEDDQPDPYLRIILRQGTLKGRYEITRKGKQILAFTGIPYAKSPVGIFRFQVSNTAMQGCVSVLAGSGAARALFYVPDQNFSFIL